jgi:PKD repeat protein
MKRLLIFVLVAQAIAVGADISCTVVTDPFNSTLNPGNLSHAIFGDPTAVLISQPAVGSITVYAATPGLFLYTPAQNAAVGDSTRFETTLGTCYVFLDNPLATNMARCIAGTTLQINLPNIPFPDPNTVTAQPLHGTCQIVNAASGNSGDRLVVYNPAPGFLGTDTFTLSLQGTFAITVLDGPPKVQASLSGGPLVAGVASQFYSGDADPGLQPLANAWDFGDGTTSTDENPIHAYAAAGTYSVTVTGTNSLGLSGTSTITVIVFAADQQPTASFVTSSINATVGQPLGFDATFSSDPGNNIVSYAWDFGDGTPIGSNVLISHVYKSIGTFTTTLTVTDSNGLTNSTSAAVVVVVAATGAATPLLAYTARFNTKKNNADSVQLVAQLNPGLSINGGTPLSFVIAGSSFSGTAASTRALSVGVQVKWTAKAVKNAPGVTQLKASVRNATLLGFPATSGKFTFPVKLSVGTHVFSTPVTNTFRFGLAGGVASGK